MTGLLNALVILHGDIDRRDGDAGYQTMCVRSEYWLSRCRAGHRLVEGS
jgi:hypothetical protein